jgi:phosphohistidine phosphatase
VFDARRSLEFSDHLAVGGDAEQLIEQITADYPAAGSLLLVGHEPSMSGFISTLVSGDQSLTIVMKKGGLCKLTVDKLQYGRCATMEWLLTPAQLVRIH